MKSQTQPQHILGIDAGGTFTDFIYVELGTTTPTIKIHKTLSTPAAPEQAILQGIHALGLNTALDEGKLHIIQGSTVATNALLEGKLARTAFITNHGFADMLQLARQTRPALYALEFAPQPPPVPPDLCFETGGRLGANGEVVQPLNTDELNTLVTEVAAQAPQAIAINLLFSFLDASFEKQIANALHKAMPDAWISRSSAVLPEYKEYERGIATWLNAALGPVVGGYLARLSKKIGKSKLQVMQSSGETIGADGAAQAAVKLLLSGPAGGLTAMQFLGELLATPRILSFDMGGTSTDVALLDGAIQISNESRISRYPVAVPMVDMHTIGAGGGSLAYVDSGGLLKVGPQSAGADPGPACYGRGGQQPTVTDANLVLGRLLADAALAGDLHLDVAAARAAVGRVAKQINLSLEDTAAGIITIANEHTARAIQLISVNRGHDPAEFVLASFGGAGGLHVCAVAEAMQMHRALVPVNGGVLSALGMVVADRGRQFSRTLLVREDNIGVDNTSADDNPNADNISTSSAESANADNTSASSVEPTNVDNISAAFAELADTGRQSLINEGVQDKDLRVAHSADMRYAGQSYTLNVPYADWQTAVAAFHALHERRYGYALKSPVELVNLRVKITAPGFRFPLPTVADGNQCKSASQTKVHGISKPVPVYRRTELPTNTDLPGPAIITEYAATTFVAPNWNCRMDNYGNLHLQKTFTDPSG
ncbi:MAG: hydantoinase/oxoprolinase family protein [Pseudohongiellaceae bacterium]